MDLDDQLIFITNNPLKIIYPKKSSRRPEGEEIKEAVDIAAARLEKMSILSSGDKYLAHQIVRKNTTIVNKDNNVTNEENMKIL